MQGLKILKENEVGFGFLLENDAGYIGLNIGDNNKMIQEGADRKIKMVEFYKNPIVHCVLQRFDVPNKNQRIYGKDILINAVEEYKKLIKMNCALGESDHADSTSVSLRNISLNIVDVYWEGNALMGKVHLPITRGFVNMGICSNSADEICNLIEHGILVGISSRAIGSVEKIGEYNHVKDDLQLVCWDFVTVPSTPLSYIYKDEVDARANIPYKDENYSTESKKIHTNSNISNKYKTKIDDFMSRF
jgi:hypothetical protein